MAGSTFVPGPLSGFKMAVIFAPPAAAAVSSVTAGRVKVRGNQQLRGVRTFADQQHRDGGNGKAPRYRKADVTWQSSQVDDKAVPTASPAGTAQSLNLSRSWKRRRDQASFDRARSSGAAPSASSDSDAGSGTATGVPSVYGVEAKTVSTPPASVKTPMENALVAGNSKPV